MKDFTAILDCLAKTITFKFKDEVFTIDLTEGDLESSWNSFETEDGEVWDTCFHWEEEWEESEPTFCVYGVDKVEEEGEEHWQINTDKEDVLTIVEVIGTKEDYFKQEKSL